MAKETAEQKLLKLIEATQAKEGPGLAASSAGQPVAGGPSVLPPADPEAQRMLAAVQGGVAVGGLGMSPVARYVGNLTRSLSFYLHNPRALGLSGLNKILLVLIFGMVVFLVVDFSHGVRLAQRDLSFLEDLKVQVGQATVGAGKAFQDMTAYLSLASRRNIFQPFERKEEKAPEAAAPAPAPQEQINARVANFRLVGVSWLTSSESVTVMIEDKQTQVTYFLKQGEELNGVKVETIFADGVTLSFAGETTTMRM